MSGRRQPVLGVLGGGQLARMLALAAAPLGVKTLAVDSVADACAGQVAPLLVADWTDYAALEAFAARVDVVTFDFENVPAETAQRLAERVAVFPNPRALAVAQDRLAEKTLFRECGLPTPDFMTVDTREQLDQALATVGAPAILKTRRLGYDGKGQFRLHDLADADPAWAALGAQAAKHGLILEAFVPFERELSVLAVRGRDGDFRTWPLTRNWHVDGVLSMSLAPAPDIELLQPRATELARTLAERLDYVGVFALELFVRNGELLGNEMAPRVHNSGHWTIEGAHTSQFENHVRAVLGLPLGDTGARSPSAMFNWIGELPDATAVLQGVDAHWHDYGKQARPGRKVGHATVCAPDAGLLATRLGGMAVALGREAQVAPVLSVLA
ncbi:MULTISPECIES: 5-(carboxyamino)imidazole ribonucleotide synthase [Rhodanobacter]|uniref:N5-carboxyaminoimidazole ribonucleotide synthase n=1 Tax=Rhodanobacter denitrificans TaxID=666685 RepID=M4NK22_9GAMM|nr:MULTISPECIES: 5-(carboxyamino)imidazole ribonucleotide synthase [Rhodanobacter]AGG90008.1 5-(carboxyamino)imidazole ribonucleotide synthase [Rhodanobacter denitrificans]KZC20327.1 5-(carboxyamino)imidazole ribonucleotide synthase [Rhodanobacter denitrificans]UJJ50122.1 5-(carboxyamino)imidazole ribonucleotide synthase [Rhodanobacter denitrificans]UJM85400.1 5-(carboxyamino)imidazole ribonucleotide synthase [Rhodanobacter denitrificans]UJM91558.1 5-(carboxyamino)imidazole ribonucleotide synt